MDWVAALLDDIDAERLLPRTHLVSRQLIELQGLGDPLISEIVGAFDAGEPVPNEHLLNKLWSKIDEVEPPTQGALRILVSLLKPDRPIDSHLADYPIGWAQDEGVPAHAINSAFRAGG